MESFETFLRHPGGRGIVPAREVRDFIDNQLQPLFYHRTQAGTNVKDDHTFTTDEQFWKKSSETFISVVKLSGFVLTDWFPRTPGLFWSRDARETRALKTIEPNQTDPLLGSYLEPHEKMILIELGGIGSIRLRPRTIDGEYCWLCTAAKDFCHAGIPLSIPELLIADSGVEWGEKVDLIGRVRFLQDAGLSQVAGAVHGNAPIIIFIEEIRRTELGGQKYPLVATPVVLFGPKDNTPVIPGEFQYSFVNCETLSNDSFDRAADWLESYADRFEGRVLTNFDERVPRLADAPLSYQRLVAKTYDRPLINQFHGNFMVERLDHLQIQEVTMNKNSIHVGGNAIVNIDSVLTNVTQTIGSSTGLEAGEKISLDAMVAKLLAELQPIAGSHPDEAKEIAEALEKAVAAASKPTSERKKPFLDLSASGLLQAAKLLLDVAPSVVHEAEKLATFIQGLV